MSIAIVFGQGGNSRAFKLVFSEAQKKLITVFGMEMVELMTRAERDREINMVDGDDDGNTALGLKKKSRSLILYCWRYACSLTS